MSKLAKASETIGPVFGDNGIDVVNACEAVH